jgi:TPR repeat protein
MRTTTAWRFRLKPAIAASIGVTVAALTFVGLVVAGEEAYRRGTFSIAAVMLQAPAACGHKRAQRLLGVMYYAGEGVHQNFEKAARWCRLGAEQGDAIAQRYLGGMYLTGEGLPTAPREGIKWIRRAAEGNDVIAQFFMGNLFLYGAEENQDCEKSLLAACRSINPAEAIMWLGRAAEYGHNDAQKALGRIYEEGVYVPRNLVLSHMWMNLSGAMREDSTFHGDSISLKEDIAKTMTPSQLAEAESLAVIWKPKRPCP